MNIFATFRYNQVVACPGLVSEAVDRCLKGDKDAFVAPTAAPRFIHCVDSYGHDARHHVAQSSWSAHYADGVVPVHCHEYRRTARTELNDPRELPFLKDIIGEALKRSTDENDVIAWGNSDVGLKPGFVEAISGAVRKFGITTMRRTESNGQPHMGRDVFAFTAGWLRANWEEFPDYVLGSPAFDLGVAAMARVHCGFTEPTTMANLKDDWFPADAMPGYALHESHQSEWLLPGHHAMASVRWNQRLFREWAAKNAPKMLFTKGGLLK